MFDKQRCDVDGSLFFVLFPLVVSSISTVEICNDGLYVSMISWKLKFRFAAMYVVLKKLVKVLTIPYGSMAISVPNLRNLGTDDGDVFMLR